LSSLATYSSALFALVVTDVNVNQDLIQKREQGRHTTAPLIKKREKADNTLHAAGCG